MESTSIGMKIHISQSTKDLLGPNYKVSERGEIDVKGKGCMKTYWLEERKGRTQLEPIPLIDNRAVIVTDAASLAGPVAIVNPSDRRKSLMDASKRISMLPRESSASGNEDRRVYSPVTFHDVARRSIANSPVKSIFSANRGRGE